MFWLKFGLIVFSIFLLVSLVRISLRKIFKIEKVKRESFSYNHVNKLHRKIDWTLRIILIITYIILMYLLIYQEYSLTNIFLITLLLFTVAEYVVRAIFELKYTQNPKQSILTISEMIIWIIVIILIIQLDLFKLLTSYL